MKVIEKKSPVTHNHEIWELKWLACDAGAIGTAQNHFEDH